MLFDTNFLIQLSRELDAGRVGPALTFLGRQRSVMHTVSVISFGELAAGMNDSQEARQFIRRFRLVTLKPEIALAAADIDRELMDVGFRLGENDNWIAGYARYYGLPVVSNDRDFDRVQGLRRIPF